MNEGDRKLLERAAKAAGGIGAGCDQTGAVLKFMNTERGALWNPLADDGDALRLAVKLGIDFKIRNEATWWDRTVGEHVEWRFEPHNGDPYAATRRAIVRAAAAIGESMP